VSAREEEVDRLLDKQAIVDCTLRYTRGVDRLDEELYRSAFWEDAVDFHGAVPLSPDEFLAWFLPQQEGREATQHYVLNHTIEIDGDTAHGETYFLAIIKWRDKDYVQMVGGRYVDRFERRNGEWRIAVRNVVAEWSTSLEVSELLGEPYAEGIRDHSDMSYERPLQALGALTAA
jgi:hypothetical protein